MLILGISAFYHDSAAVLVADGNIVAAAQEERFTRKKNDAAFPRRAIRYCIEEAGATWGNIDLVVFYEKPLRKAGRLLRTFIEGAPKGFRSFHEAFYEWAPSKLWQKDLIVRELEIFSSNIDWPSRILFCEHHLSHAASAFFPSPFENAAILTADGVGEFVTTSISIGTSNHISRRKEIHFPHSLGLLYSAFTDYLGFKVNSGEYKVMGLAPYGRPQYVDSIYSHLIEVKKDGSFRLNMSFFAYCTEMRMINDRFCSLFGRPARTPETQLEQFHMDIAASIQQVLDEIMLLITRNIASETGIKNLCIAGGVGLNCVSNGKILRDGKFDDIWIQPAAGDAGGALGAALAVYHGYLGNRRQCRGEVADQMKGCYLGPQFSQKQIECSLTAGGGVFKTLPDEQLLAACAEVLAEGGSLGWFQGRLEFGPRALGNRSIVADPRSPIIQTSLNLKIKFRESFRPFAPAVLAEDQSKYFELDRESPYMLFVAQVAHEQKLIISGEEQLGKTPEIPAFPCTYIPGVTHVDGSARIQTVNKRTNPRFHALLSSFKEITGCSVLVNTSFNVRGEPIVCTPEEAFVCFMNTGIEAMAIGNCFLRKADQIAQGNSIHSVFPCD